MHSTEHTHTIECVFLPNSLILIIVAHFYEFHPPGCEGVCMWCALIAAQMLSTPSNERTHSTCFCSLPLSLALTRGCVAPVALNLSELNVEPSVEGRRGDEVATTTREWEWDDTVSRRSSTLSHTSTATERHTHTTEKCEKIFPPKQWGDGVVTVGGGNLFLHTRP